MRSPGRPGSIPFARLTRPMSREASPPSRPTSTPPLPMTWVTCTAMSSSGIPINCPPYPSPASTHRIPRACGTGWTHCAPRALKASPFPIIPTAPTARCSNWWTGPATPWTMITRHSACATNRWWKLPRSRAPRIPTRYYQPMTSGPTSRSPPTGWPPPCTVSPRVAMCATPTCAACNWRPAAW